MSGWPKKCILKLGENREETTVGKKRTFYGNVLFLNKTIKRGKKRNFSTQK